MALSSSRSASRTKTRQKDVSPKTPLTQKNNRPKKVDFLFYLFLVGAVLFLLGFLHLAADKTLHSPTVTDEDGNVILAPERQLKLQKELEEIDNAQQYVLIATMDGYYPCYTCPAGKTTLFLYKGEVWRYGVTRKGEKIRYPGENYGAPDVIFIVQFEGDYTNCLKQEKIKIYNYPLLPEAQKRKVKLFRPPGNANDS